ncbi:S-DNA-T family DNA segregation ATPase FtsK/SpoIIIE [Streptomyces sp. PvR006]|uniref:cell division protein FtsK n=1 Tax=Streptomyces sp. PvR006 TaxID=2817860 RepID=UPI001AE94839|nr:cell division protein FtsK [Streptomyces sp. PvR006]MBP2585035.1 S-DNA-T family DNA segregation ATPase FtsK/SpoIIIE [Streptomyces sp. PvR006]
MTETPTAAHLRPVPDIDPDDEAPTTPTMVDNPALPDPKVTIEKRKPVLAGWLTNRRDFLATARHTGANIGYAALFHGVRIPVYAGRLALMSPRGTCRFIASTNRWVWDREAAPLRDYAVRTEDVEEYMRLSKLRAGRIRLRGLVTLVALVFGASFALWLYVVAPAYLFLFATGGVLLLGMAGQQPDAPVVGPAVLKTEIQKLTGSIVLRGLDSIGNAKISAAIKKGGDMNGLRFTSEIVRDGPGYRADLDLPYGITPEDIMEARKPLASGLRRKVGCVWPSPDPAEHEGRLILWVGDKPMNETTKPAWPLLKTGSVDLFKPIVFGNDQRMRDVTVTLMFAAIVIGSVPRMGKTFLMRLLLLIAALDPRAEIHAFDFKGTGDFGALEPVCHRYRAGEDDEDIEYVVASLRELKEELRRRAKVIKSLPRSRCPESKVTPELASDKSLGLHPIVVGLDECQVPFEHKEYGEELEEICTDITKRGPALGIVGLFGTQRPDAKSLPTGISANAILRFCLKVMSHTANDMVLGTGAYKAGIRATMFSRSDRGICWMAGEGDDPRIVASAFVDAVAAEQVVARARKAREDYGNVTGHAIGKAPEKTDGSDILADVLDVILDGEKAVWCERIATRLASLRPETYAGWKGENVTAAVKPYGIKTGQVWGTTDEGKGANRRGIDRTDITAAITRRNADRAAA